MKHEVVVTWSDEDQVIQPPYEFLVRRQHLAHLDECPDDVDARFDGPREIENGRRHDAPVLP